MQAGERVSDGSMSFARWMRVGVLFIDNRTINGNRPLGPVCSNDEPSDDRRSAVMKQSLF